MMLALRHTLPADAPRASRLGAAVIETRLVTRYAHAGVVIGETLYHSTAARGVHAEHSPDLTGWPQSDPPPAPAPAQTSAPDSAVRLAAMQAEIDALRQQLAGRPAAEAKPVVSRPLARRAQPAPPSAASRPAPTDPGQAAVSAARSAEPPPITRESLARFRASLRPTQPE